MYEIIVYWFTDEKTNFYFLAYILINLVCVMFQSDLKKRNASHASIRNAFFIASLTVCLIYFLDIKGLYRGAETVLRRQISVLATNNLGHKWPVVPLYIPTKETWSFNMISRPNRAWFLFLIHWRQTCDHNIDIFFPTARLSSIWTLQINFITSAWNLFISFDFKN